GQGDVGISGSGNTVGVLGSAATTGVSGSGNTVGVVGQTTSVAANTAAVQGVNQSSGANGHGVVGQARTGYGVLGYTTAGSASLAGVSDHTNIPAFAGGNNAPNGLAASFSGTVYVNGSFVVQDPANKHGAIKHPDGSYRLLSSVESPESWVEDFGKGTLASGAARVTLDPDFAAVVQADRYLVFLTETGAHHGLYVTNQGAGGFEVRSADGQGAEAFYWRVVAKPKTDKKLNRLEKFVPPNVPLPDIANLPKAADPPAPPKMPDAPPPPQPPARTSPPAA